MELSFDTRPSMQPTPGALHPMRPAVRSRPSDDDDKVPAPGWRETSAWLPCECPDDCPRDHQNE